MFNGSRATNLRNIGLFLGLFAAITPSPPLQAQDASASITEAEVQDHIFFLASDALGGRGTGDAGYQVAADYAASQFSGAGVQPLFRDAAGNPSFFQNMAMSTVSFGSENHAVVLEEGSSTELTFGQDYFVLAGPEGETSQIEGPLVFAGYGLVSEAGGWDDTMGLDLNGSIPIVMFGFPPPELTSAFAGVDVEDLWDGFGRKIATMEARGAKAVVAVLEPTRWRAWNNYARRYASSRLVVGEARPLSEFPDAGIPVIFLSQDAVNALFADRGFDPATGEGEYDTFSFSGTRLDLTFQSSRQRVDVPNVAGWVEGTDPILRNEYVVVGAHLDHVGTRNGEVYNGADDNASGSVGVMEIAEAVAMDPPKRSTIFVLYTGEERGLLGSRYFVENPPVPADQMVVNVNIEMIGRYEHRPLGTGQLFAIIGTRDGEVMRRTIAEVNGTGFDYEWEIPEEFMGGSDHQAYEALGIPNITVAASPPYGTHEDYHRPGDDAEKIDVPGLRKATAFIYALTIHLANLPAL